MATAMLGKGEYNKHSQIQGSAAMVGLDCLERAVGELPIENFIKNKGGVVRVVDYASSQGRNSVEPMKVAVGKLLDLGAKWVEVVHEDLVENDFTTLSSLVGGKASYVKPEWQDRVFVLMQGCDFRKRLAPDNSVALGWSSTCQHWMGEKAQPHQGGVWIGALAPVNPNNAQVAKEEWLAWLKLREKELVPGGQIVHVEILAGGPLSSMPNELLAMIGNAFVQVFGQDGANQLSLPFYNRTKEEFLEPFNNNETNLVVKEFNVVDLPDKVWDEYSTTTNDAKLYANKIFGMVNAALFPALGLVEKFGNEKVVELGNHIKREIESNPTKYRCVWSVGVFRIAKKELVLDESGSGGAAGGANNNNKKWWWAWKKNA